jgi:hypothetical protein
MIVIPSEVYYQPRFTYIWTLGVLRFPGALRRRMNCDTALREIARCFLADAGMTIAGELARVTGLSRVEAGRGNRALVAEGYATITARGSTGWRSYRTRVSRRCRALCARTMTRSMSEGNWGVDRGRGDRQGDGAMTLLDDWMPAFDVSARHSLDVRASPARVYAIARTVPLGTPLLVRVLMGLRAIPTLAARALSRGQRPALQAGRANGPGGLPFTLLAEEPGAEFVLGLAGRFWTPAGGIVESDADTFRSPPRPGLAHATWNFRIAPRPNGCCVMTETRVLCADEATRASFLRYWRVVRPGSGLIRRSILREIRRRAERADG